MVLFTRDLRVRDQPALATAAREAERIVPLFVFDDTLWGRSCRLSLTTRSGPSNSGVFGNRGLGRYPGMAPSSILVIVVGIVLALLVNYILGIIVILIGLAMLLMPMLGGTRRRV